MALVIKLDLAETQAVAEDLAAAAAAGRSVLVWCDPLDGAFKVKIGGGVWSPPIGQAVER